MSNTGSVDATYTSPPAVVPQKRTLEVLSSRQKTKVTRACDLCKAKKSKCSGEQPCESCSRRGVQCQYEAFYSRGKAPAPRRQTNIMPSTPGGISYPQPILSIAPGQIKPMEPKANTSTAMLSHSMEREIPQDPPSRASPGLEVAGQYSDTTSGLAFLHRAWRRISKDENTQVLNRAMGSAEDNQLLVRTGDKPFLETRAVQLPPVMRCRELLSLYFDVCIATYRLLHKPTVESWLAVIFENIEHDRPLHDSIGRAKAATVLAALAVACLHQENTTGGNSDNLSLNKSSISQPQSDELFCEALRLTAAETGIPRLESAQCRIVQVLYLLMSCRLNQAWYTFGHSLQIISTLGLHRRDAHKRASQRHNYIDKQCRRRTFWVAYTLDKYLSVIFGRPRHYHDEDIDQEFPALINDEDMTSAGPQASYSNDCYIDALVFHAQLAQIAGRISREVYAIKPIPELDRLAAAHRLGAELVQWKKSLPPFLGAINPSSLIPSFRRQATALKLSYCHAVMLAHRPFLLKNNIRRDGEMATLANKGLVECILAAQTVLDVVDRMGCEGRLFHGNWWTHYVCFCALVVVYVWAIQESSNSTTFDERCRMLDQAERCLQYLAHVTATNSPSRRYSIILQEMRGEAKRKTARPVRMQAMSLSNGVSTTLSPRSDGSFHATSSESHSQPDSIATPVWQPLFGSPIEIETTGVQNFLDDWQMTDWLHLDSSAFGTFPEFDTASLEWIGDLA